MFTSANIAAGDTRHRYLIKHQGVWKILKTWAVSPEWDDEVTDVIWLKSQDMIASWWQMKDGRRYIKRTPERVEDDELAFLLLQVEA